MAAPKRGELTAIASHHGGKDNARAYFINGFTETFSNLQESSAVGLPTIIVYASKEQKGSADEVTRWSSILTAIVQSGLQITGTWPILGTAGRRVGGERTNVVAAKVGVG